MQVTTSDRTQLARLGFVVRRGVFDPAPLAAEVTRALREGTSPLPEAGEPPRFRYVPMMCELTPVSLRLLDQLAVLAGDLLGDEVLPTRAKGVEYRAPTGWHADTNLNVHSIGMLAYLDPMEAGQGALEVVPGSHEELSAHALAPTGNVFGAHRSLELATDPGDLIIMDERLLHRSTSADRRRQWRVDYLPVPRTPTQRAVVRGYFKELLAGDDGYDRDRYPSYGAHWRTSSRPSNAVLGALGAYDAWPGNKECRPPGEPTFRR